MERKIDKITRIFDEVGNYGKYYRTMGKSTAGRDLHNQLGADLDKFKTRWL